MKKFESSIPETILMAQEAVAAGNHEINDQNDRHERTSGIASEAIRAITRDGIHDEQVESFLKVLQGARDIPYEKITAETQRLESEVQEIDALYAETSNSLARDRELALQLTTKRQNEILEAYQTEVETAKQKRLHEVRDELEFAYGELEAVGEAWPIPQLLTPEQRNHLFEAVKSTDEAGIIVDIIPVTPTKIQRIGAIAAKAERQIENPDLSKNILFYLREEVGNTVTVEDLIRFCCKLEDSKDEENYRGHITSALGPETEGPKKQRELHKHGLKLQYGYRYLYMKNKEGRLVQKRRTRIYRVVEMGANAEPSVVSTSENVQIQDEWENAAAGVSVQSHTPFDALQTVPEEVFTVDENHESYVNGSGSSDSESEDVELNEAGVLMLEKATARAIARTLKKRCLAGESNPARQMSNVKAIKKSVMNASEALKSAVNP